MAPASPNQNDQIPPLVQRLLKAFPVFGSEDNGADSRPQTPTVIGLDKDEREERCSDSDILLIPEGIIFQSDSGGNGSSSSFELLPETDAATWLTTHVQSTEDIMLSRIPAWGVEGVTTCIFPKVVALRWPSIVYEPIDKVETSCLHVRNI